MNDINFLPRSIIEEQARLQRRVREVICVLLVLVSLAVWNITAANTIAVMEDELNTLKSELSVDRKRDRELIGLQVEYAALVEDARTQRRLTIPVETLDIIKVVASVMPDEIAVSDFALRTPSPLVAADPFTQKVKMHIVGLAPDDVVVADFVDALAGYPMFDDVKMLYSRASATDANKREFRIEMQVPLDRNYRHASEGKEDNHAS